MGVQYIQLIYTGKNVNVTTQIFTDYNTVVSTNIAKSCGNATAITMSDEDGYEWEEY